MVDWTRLGAMIRAGVDDAPIARVVGIRCRNYSLSSSRSAQAGRLRRRKSCAYLSVYPVSTSKCCRSPYRCDSGGSGSLLGALVGSFIIGFLYNFGQAMFPTSLRDPLLPMLLVLLLRPQAVGKVVP